MERRKLIALAASIVLVLALVLTGCPAASPTPSASATATATPTATGTVPTPTPQIIEVEKEYSCLNPQGEELPVEISGLAVRLDTLDGKNIYIIQGEADPIIIPALVEVLLEEYPDTNWVYYQPQSGFGPTTVDAEVRDNADAVIRGISWCSGATYAQSTYTANCEKAGIPAVLLGFQDNEPQAKSQALRTGVPKIRFVYVPRVGIGRERVDQFLNECLDALVRPLTEEEQQVGLYTPSPDPRICFEGNLDDAHEFYQKTTVVANCKNCPIAQWTDGLPVVIPTEAKVKEMLTGTSHSPGEYIPYERAGTVRMSSSGVTVQVEAGDPVRFVPTQRAATVEKVAVNAVMAGCKPEYLPVVLAIASSGGMMVTSSNMWSYFGIVSGPYAKEIGMSAGQGAMNPGNPANATIGRAWQLLAINIGGALAGVTRIETPGSPFNLGGTMIAEDDEEYPEGWVSLREEYKHYVSPDSNEQVAYTKQDSIVMLMVFHGAMHTTQFAPSSFRALSSGQGGLARRLGVEGTPGNYNFLEYIIEELVWASEGRGWGGFLIMHPDMAQSLKDYGFATKQAVYDWLEQVGMRPISFFRQAGWYDFQTNGGENVEPTTGLKYKELPDSFMYPMLGRAANQGIVVAFHPGDETCVALGGSRGSAYWIDPWK